MRSTLSLVCAIVLASVAAVPFAHAAHAAKDAKPEPNVTSEADWAAPVSPETDFLTDASFTKLLKASKTENTRAPSAAIDVPRCEAQIPGDFKAMRDELIGGGSKKGIETPVQLDAFINRYQDAKVYDQLSPEAQFLAIQLRSLPAYRSIVFRSKDYVGKYAAVRVMIVSLMRGQTAAIQAFFPASAANVVNTWDVIYRYMTEPQAGMGAPIRTDGDLMTLVTQLAHSSALRTNDLAKFISVHPSVWWDNRIYAPFANFTSDQDRCVMLGAPELYSIYASSALATSGIVATSGYSLDGLQAAMRDVGQLIGIELFAAMGPQGISSMSRTQVLRKYPKLFLKTAQGNQRMSDAFGFLTKAARAAQLSFEETKRLPPNQENLFDPRVAFAVTRQAESSFSEINALLTGKDVESTVINGEKIRVNIAGFYQNPPGNLMDLMPVAWVRGPEQTKVPAWGRMEYQRNYKYGMATAWNVQPYRTLFPDVTSADGRTTPDIPKYARVLSQTWGASAFALPLGMFLF